MAQARSMPVFTDALISDTTDLSAEQFGAYCLLLFATWRNNGVALKDDPDKLARICRVSKKRWVNHLRPVLLPFFDLRNDACLHQKRLEKEWAYVAEQRAINSEKGRAGAHSRWHKNDRQKNATSLQNNETGYGRGNAQAMGTQTHTQEEEMDRRVVPFPETTEPSKTPAASGRYAFEGRLIRLVKRDFDEWRRRYHGIADLMAELGALDDFYDRELTGEDRKRWFIRCSAALAKKHQLAVAAARPDSRELTERYPNEGVYGASEPERDERAPIPFHEEYPNYRDRWAPGEEPVSQDYRTWVQENPHLTYRSKRPASQRFQRWQR